MTNVKSFLIDWVPLEDGKVLLHVSKLNPHMPYVSYDTVIWEELT